MILATLRRDDAVRGLGLWLLASAVHAGVLISLYLWYLADRGLPEAPVSALRAALLLGWFLLAPYLAWGHTHRRCSELELALPLAAGRLWLRHLAAVVLAGTLILASAAAVAVWWLVQLEVGARLGADLEVGRLAASLVLGLVLAVLILEGGRAVEAVYGHRLSAREIRHRYLDVDIDGVRFRGGRFALLDDHPDLEPRPEGPLFPAVLALVGVPWLILLAFFLRAFESGWSPVRYRRLVVALTVAVALALLVLDVIDDEHRVLDLGAAVALLEVLLRRLGGSTAGTLAVWGVSAMLLAVAYRLAEDAFRRAELPRPTLKGDGHAL